MSTNNLGNSILYGFLGAVLGLCLSYGIVLLPQYLMDALNKPSIGEFSMLGVLGAPLLAIIGTILGVIYARRYKK